MTKRRAGRFRDQPFSSFIKRLLRLRRALCLGFFLATERRARCRRSSVLDPEGLLVCLTADGEDREVIAGRRNTTTSAAAEVSATTTTATTTAALGRRIHSDDAPDAIDRIDVGARRITCTTATGRNVGRSCRGRRASAAT